MHRAPAFVPLLMAVPLLLTGCGQGHPTALTDGSASPSLKETRTPEVTKISRPHRSSTGSDVTGPLAGFPLDLGYADENGDDGTEVQITNTPASSRFGACHRPVWDPRHRTRDVIGVEFRGEAEDVRGRTLVLYADADAAVDAVTAARGAVAACPDDPDGKGQGITHTILDEDLGEQSLVWTDTYYTVREGEEQHDTGLVVFVLVRVGDAVLLGYEYGEGNGSASTRDQAVAHAVRAGESLAERMQRLAPGV